MLTRATILAALTQLSEELARSGVLGELNVVGGTAMVLAFNARRSAKAAVVVVNLALPADWLNDAAKGFMSASGDFAPNLRVQLSGSSQDPLTVVRGW